MFNRVIITNSNNLTETALTINSDLQQGPTVPALISLSNQGWSGMGGNIDSKGNFYARGAIAAISYSTNATKERS